MPVYHCATCGKSTTPTHPVNQGDIPTCSLCKQPYKDKTDITPIVSKTESLVSQDTADVVNHPAHYEKLGEIQLIDALEDWDLPFHKAVAVQYIVRAGIKDPEKAEEDLNKAIWYLERYIAKIKKQEVKQ